ncbi:hypothetical protein GUJ93_ZPchr0006g42616 [Zizania palustris]|uniref:Uncharacterized protein n=1 Tax=Zizania palustris TaxID=103762 RepID=A0A8J5T8J0_ZIZPA|nr:hypothetical protein GUJ93_ZPchr0006g42616 [Zizania palustris]
MEGSPQSAGNMCLEWLWGKLQIVTHRRGDDDLKRWRPEGRRDLIRQQHRQADAVIVTFSSSPITPTTKPLDRENTL